MKNYDQFPKTIVKNVYSEVIQGWHDILETIYSLNNSFSIALETYPGVNEREIIKELEKSPDYNIFNTKEFLKDSDKIDEILEFVLTDDRVFGHMTSNNIIDFFDENKINMFRIEQASTSKKAIVIGFGASLVLKTPNIIYFNLPRWEIQMRYRRGMANYFKDNKEEDSLKKYKQGYFLEWRLADKLKVSLFHKALYFVDTTVFGKPKMITSRDYKQGLLEVIRGPFRLVPFFDPGVWGGQWMKEKFSLPEKEVNYAWSFDGVPEENSLLLVYNDVELETPAIDVVLMYPEELLGQKVYDRFGAEFPIRFDLLDTMHGQNLSLQVHPNHEYIRKNFGMTLAQEESYYILDCDDDGSVYLGLKANVDEYRMIKDLRDANLCNLVFDDEKYVNKYRAHKHDHFLIPPGTIHGAGKNTMILEISTSAYIFTFKLWDWERLGLDSRPRPIHIDHASNVIKWDRDTEWVEKNLINRIEIVEENDNVKIEKTGLHDYQFIDSYRYWIYKEITLDTKQTLNVLNLVEGSAAVVSSVDRNFDDYEVHYAETFIIPANIGKYNIRPRYNNERIVVVCALVRGTEN